MLSDLVVCLGPDGTTFDAYLGVALLERVGADPRCTQRKMLIGRLFNAGFPVGELAAAFGHDPRTIKKWGAALCSQDLEVMMQAFAGRSGRRKTTTVIERFVWLKYQERRLLGRNYRAKIIAEVARVFGVRLSTTTINAICAAQQARHDAEQAARAAQAAMAAQARRAAEQAATAATTVQAATAAQGTLPEAVLLSPESAPEPAPAPPPESAPGSTPEPTPESAPEAAPEPPLKSAPESAPEGALPTAGLALVPEGANRAITCQGGGSSASDLATSGNQSPVLMPLQEDVFPGGEMWLHHIGLALFAPALALFANAFERQLLAQILLGAVNIEQAKTLCRASLAYLVQPLVLGLAEQRRLLDTRATPLAVIEVYRRNAELLADGPNRGTEFYFDPHVKEYTGQLKVLKGWCGRVHGVVKSLNLDCFHTLSGRPCFVQHYSPYYDMRERFFFSRSQFDLLFAADRRSGRTFVIDRGIYSLPVLQSFGADYVITWEKGYSGGGWQDDKGAITAVRELPRNSSKDLRQITFQFQETRWRRDATFRRLIVRITKPGREALELAIITSNPHMDAQDVIWIICRRWLQENDFKYLAAHFGLNQLTSRQNHTFADCAGEFADRPVESPEYHELKAQVAAAESALGKLLVAQRQNARERRQLERQQTALDARRRNLLARLQPALDHLNATDHLLPAAAQLSDQADQIHHARLELTSRLLANTKRHDHLAAAITTAETTIEPLETTLCTAIRKQSRIQLLCDGDYHLLDPRRKAYMDALRITAANIFRNVLDQFRPYYDNYRDDHVFLRLISRCGGTVERTAEAIVIRLWPPGALPPYRQRALNKLLGDIETQAQSVFGATRRLCLRLVHGPRRR
jgi:hypothetical protein